MVEPRSQKGRSLLAIEKSNFPSIGVVLVHDRLDAERACQKFSGQRMFGRPCPEDAQHGFVDSVCVENADDIMVLLAKAQEADPKAEVAVMPFVEAECSAIMTPNSISVGPGHEGATGGDRSMIFYSAPPTDGVPKEYKTLFERSGIDDTPYIELLYGEDGLVTFVQCRNGPPVPSSPDFIPHDMRIEHVVEAEGDLLEWKEKVAQFKPNTAVNHAGGNPSSHFFVHCNLKNVPIFTTHEVRVGQRIFKNAEEKVTSPIGLIRGLEHGIVADLSYEQALAVMLFGLHQQATNPSKISSKLAGLGIASALRLGTAACLGEFRHKQKGSRRFSRSQIFEEAWKDAFDGRRRMAAATKSFAFSDWKSGYGGSAWLECAKANLALWDACILLFKKPTVENADSCIELYNLAVNQVHNNGWMYNKFSSENLMDQASNSEPLFTIRAARALWKAWHSENSSSEWRRLRRSRILKRVSGDTEAEKKLEREIIKIQFKDNSSANSPFLHFQIKYKGVEVYATSNYQYGDGADYPNYLVLIHEWGTDETSMSNGSNTPYYECHIRELHNADGQKVKWVYHTKSEQRMFKLSALTGGV